MAPEPKMIINASEASRQDLQARFAKRQELRNKIEAQTNGQEEFYNHTHDAKGRFGPGGSSGSGGSFEKDKLLAVSPPGEQGVSIKQSGALKAKGGVLKGPNAQLTTLVNDTVDAIDSVHRVAPFQVTVSHTKKLPPGVQGRYTGSLRQILINQNTDPAVQKFTLLHEYGHHMDAVMQRVSVRDSGLNKAWENSAAVTKMREDPRFHPGFKSYALSHTELWARSYAQWMADKTKDKPSQDINAQRAQFGYQWEKKDFAPISKEMDRIFKTYGILKKP